MRWNRETIEALAPDAASIKAAQKLNSLNKWPLRQYNDRAIWGHCQGSGKKPYLTRIDVAEPAFKCSCPSRKFPCKHGLALFILYAENQSEFTPTDPCPDWVLEWLDSRDDRSEKKAAKAAAPAKPVDEQAQLKRQQQRSDNVRQGIADLRRWMEDTVQLGLAELVNKNFAYWRDIAARLVDSQAPGLANRINELGSIAVSGKDVMPRLVEKFGQLHLLLEAYARLDTLPEALQHDVRQLIGWSRTQDELLALPGVSDHWLVLGVLQRQDDNLINQTSWLYGLQHQQAACIVQYAHSSQRSNLSIGWQANMIIDGTLHFYPSATPIRAIVGEHQINDLIDKTQMPEGVTIDQAMADFKALQQLNPWHQGTHLWVKNVRFISDGEQLYLCDTDNPKLALLVSDQQCDVWQLMAMSGGHTVNCAFEFNGQTASPLGIEVDGFYYCVLSKGAL